MELPQLMKMLSVEFHTLCELPNMKWFHSRTSILASLLYCYLPAAYSSFTSASSSCTAGRAAGGASSLWNDALCLAHRVDTLIVSVTYPRALFYSHRVDTLIASTCL